MLNAMAWAKNELGRKGRAMRKKKLYLQLFAEGDDGAGADGDNTSQGNGDGADSNNNQEGPVSFEDFLNQEGNQAEFDRRVQKAITTAVSNEKKKWKALTDDKLTEAERLAKMTKDEKKDYEISKLKKQLEDAEKEKTRNSMSSTARKMLSDEGISIPDELLMHLVSDSAENTKDSVSSFASMFKNAIKEAVAEKLKGNPPKTGGETTMTKEQILAIKDPMERQEKIAENLKLFQ
ncbi:MAG: DUF4355 domain-containing protein [Eubacteriales bacterium]|nr:DUF4355 domain-containing protein [Eubacteriales bacterium]